ncbi:hypothetical protein I7I50_07092 [Histoplasma capsulatum G186AR]|uniref:Uncharacterized protein n=1 Tax=Ajellomyces capsulatus TaxID=5037 RepID=A0A8H7Z1K2_AJECA|nr:hypothetical protein I7I52_09870 [Histoplasma capsulatum]QSS67888.1 hypothetical protein I7I50_07092 [Histoplasma capsulatum G186AR]
MQNFETRNKGVVQLATKMKYGYLLDDYRGRNCMQEMTAPKCSVGPRQTVVKDRVTPYCVHVGSLTGLAT